MSAINVRQHQLCHIGEHARFVSDGLGLGHRLVALDLEYLLRLPIWLM
jgi:hypothetical protein